jgi:hypothetical protein
MIYFLSIIVYEKINKTCFHHSFFEPDALSASKCAGTGINRGDTMAGGDQGWQCILWKNSFTISGNTKARD